MFMYEYKIHPDAYVQFVWGGDLFEGELFSDSEKNCKNSETTNGCIRPFNKWLRQRLVDDRVRYQVMVVGLLGGQYWDFERLISNKELTECDGVSTRTARTGELESVTKFWVVDRKELLTSQKEIDDCRMDMLYRQRIIARKTESSEEVRNSIDAAIAELDAPRFKPLNYRAKARHKVMLRVGAAVGFVVNIIIIIIWVIIFISVAMSFF